MRIRIVVAAIATLALFTTPAVGQQPKAPEGVWFYTESQDALTDADESYSTVTWHDPKLGFQLLSVICTDDPGIMVSFIVPALPDPGSGERYQVWYRVDDLSPMGPFSPEYRIFTISDIDESAIPVMEFVLAVLAAQERLLIRWDYLGIRSADSARWCK